MVTVVEKDKGQLLNLATSELTSLFQNHKSKPILFLISGGSAFDLLVILHIPKDANITIGVLDERYSTDPHVNNFAQLESTDFFKTNESQFVNILDTKVQNEESLEEFAKRFETLLKNWKTANPDGVLIATLGMGPDGHIAGINPSSSKDFDSLFVSTDKWVVGYESNLKPSQRATTTFPFLKQIDYGVAWITGEQKRDALTRVVAKNGELSETPARILRALKNATIFTDIEST